MLSNLNRTNIVKIYVLDFQGRLAIEEDSMISESYLMKNLDNLKILNDHLTDEKSKAALETFIHQKIYGEYAKPYSRCKQYFEEEIIDIKGNECFVDCGGFDGEDTLYFANLVKHKKGYLCNSFVFEPDPVNYNNILTKFENQDNMTVFNIGVSDVQGEMRFESVGRPDSHASNDGNIMVKIDKLDNILKGKNVTFLKMDIEGYELRALHGANKLIKRCKPKLAICVYHRREDIFTIPQYILSIHEDYKFYFRNYAASSTEAVLYAV